MKLHRKPKPRRRKSLTNDCPVQGTIQSGTGTGTNSAKSEAGYPNLEDLKKHMAIIATSAWKARSRMIDTATGEIRNEMKRTSGDIERIERCLNNLGVVVEDHTRKPFDYGLPWHVVATKPIPGLPKEIVTETLKPTVRWNEQIIQHAEVEIGTPV